MPHITLGRMVVTLLITIFSFFGINSIFNIIDFTSAADMRIEPGFGSATVGEKIIVDIIVAADTPVNVFKGLINFDPSRLKVVSIDYNTSIADLWAELPWYSNGDGTLSFVGGTTRQGGFTGEGSLIKVVFETLEVGQTDVGLNEVRILKHDGLGSDEKVDKPIDAIFAIETPELEEEIVLRKDTEKQTLEVLPEPINTDLNQDGKKSFVDTSIFMADFATQNLRSDFNMDGKVNSTDLSVLMNDK